MHKLTKAGQIKKGDTIVLSDNGNGEVHTAMQVLFAGTDKEEVIVNLEKNRYFITGMVLSGKSWAKQVKFAPKPKNYEQGRAEMQAECLGVLEGEFKEHQSVMHSFDEFEPEHIAVMHRKHAIENAINKLKELK